MKDSNLTLQYTTQNKRSQSHLTPKDAIALLKEGNNRFLNQKLIKRNYIQQINQTQKDQHPFAAILSCIDSRIPTEIIFDQGIGDVFNARVAGNIVNEDILGSLEYACKVAGAKIIVVMGHTQCGAIKGLVDKVKMGNLTGLLQKIEPAIYSVTFKYKYRDSDYSDYIQTIAEENVALTISNISEKSEILNQMIQSKTIMVIGAMYDVSTGKVTFID